MKIQTPATWIAPVTTLALLISVLGYSLTLPGPKNAEGYHARVRAAADQAPRSFGQWTGKVQDIPRGSVKLLRPNAAIRVQFRAEHHYMRPVEFLFVQCRDARDLAGHFPPKCYPSVSGYVLEESTPRNWEIGGVTIHGMVYRFTTSEAPEADTIYVYHFMALPDGRTVREMSEIYAAGADYLRRHHGAAQCQVLFGQQDLTEADRDLAFEEIIAAHAPLIAALDAADLNE